MQTESGPLQWAREVFGGAQLGDPRRTRLGVKMAARSAKGPAGQVASVFRTAAERQAAYDFLEHDHVRPGALICAVGESTAQRAAEHPFVFVALDGSSLTLVDKARAKDFGSIGTPKVKSGLVGARGLKVMTALAVSPKGMTLGVVEQEWWSRQAQPSISKKKKVARNRLRKTSEKETQHWLNVMQRSAERLEEAGAKAWFQLDREGDSQDILMSLAQTGHTFTVRSSFDRRLTTSSGEKLYLLEEIDRAPVIATLELDVPSAPGRKARLATMEMKAFSAELRLRNRRTNIVKDFPVTVVAVSEVGTTPTGEKPIRWRLLTNHPIETALDALDVVTGYALRWRIEDYHRTWKDGGCHIEDTQLRSKNAIIKWATILGAVATRIERLKHLARTQPTVRADVELSPIEIKALILLKRMQKKKTEVIPDGVPSISDAVLWIAEIGGYTGKSSGGPPGSTTIARGMERLQMATEILTELQDAKT